LAKDLYTSKPKHFKITALNTDELDITDEKACSHSLKGHEPVWVINTAAFTAVDLAETEVAEAFLNSSGM
jgi:dTDP-4-dehydrorhamnose reductase